MNQTKQARQVHSNPKIPNCTSYIVDKIDSYTGIKEIKQTSTGGTNGSRELKTRETYNTFAV